MVVVGPRGHQVELLSPPVSVSGWRERERRVEGEVVVEEECQSPLRDS